MTEIFITKGGEFGPRDRQVHSYGEHHVNVKVKMGVAMD